MGNKNIGIELYSWNEETKEFYFLGHKIDYVSNPSEWQKYLNDLILENECLGKRLKHLLKSKIISKYDEKIPMTGEYRLNIEDLDKQYKQKYHKKIKYELQEKVYVVFKEDDGIVRVFSSAIDEITISKEYEISYYVKDIIGEEFKDEELIPIDRKDLLIEKIDKLLSKEKRIEV